MPIFAKPGFEADDLIATMAKRLCEQDFEIFMVSKDKDLRQILNDCTQMYDVQSDEVIDAAKLEEKCGYTPARGGRGADADGRRDRQRPGHPRRRREDGRRS